MKINRNALKKLILEEMNKMEEQEIPPVIKAPPKASSAPTPDKKEPAEPAGELPTDLARDLKILGTTKFVNLVGQNINTQKEVDAYLKSMLDLLKSADPKMVVRALRNELAERSKQA